MRFEELKGKIFKSVVGKVGGEEMVFETIVGEKYKLYHGQD